MYRIALTTILAMAIISGCAPKAIQPVPTPTSTNTLTPTTQPSATSTNTPAATPTDIPTATETKAPSLTITPLAEGRIIIKETKGLPITGTLYGHGETAVILASVGGMSESQWSLFGKYLAENGFTALAISSPDSQGDTTVLVSQAIEFLRNNGYRRIVCAGASNGASGCAFNLKVSRNYRTTSHHISWRCKSFQSQTSQTFCCRRRSRPVAGNRRGWF